MIPLRGAGLPLRGIADDQPPSAKRLQNLHAGAVRLVARPFRLGSPFDYAYRRLRSDGLSVVAVLTSDSYDLDGSTYAEQTAEYVRIYPEVTIWLVGNEWNIDGDASWPVGEDAFVEFWNLVAPVLPPGKAYLGGYFMVDGAPNLLYGALQRLIPRPDGVDLHPYLDTTPTFEETTTFLQEAGYLVSVTEWNASQAKIVTSFQRLMDDLGIVASMFIPWMQGPADLPGVASPKTGRLTARGIALRDAYQRQTP